MVMVNPFDLKTVLLAKLRATCRPDPFSDRSVSCGGGIRLDRIVDEALRPLGRSVLQSSRGRNLDDLGSRCRCSSVCFDCDDLAGVVGAFPRATKDGLLPELSPSG